jgi:hypothetical protein
MCSVSPWRHTAGNTHTMCVCTTQQEIGTANRYRDNG